MRVSNLVPDSRGRHALLALFDEKKQKGVVDASHVPQPTLSQIASRIRLPGREAAGKLAKLGIEYGWWDEPPTKAQLKRAAERKAEEEHPPDSESRAKPSEKAS